MLLLDTLQIQLICDVDEMQSVTGYKKRQCWLWHAWGAAETDCSPCFGSRGKKMLCY